MVNIRKGNYRERLYEKIYKEPEDAPTENYLTKEKWVDERYELVWRELGVTLWVVVAFYHRVMMKHEKY